MANRHLSPDRRTGRTSPDPKPRFTVETYRGWTLIPIDGGARYYLQTPTGETVWRQGGPKPKPAMMTRAEAEAFIAAASEQAEADREMSR